MREFLVSAVSSEVIGNDGLPVSAERQIVAAVILLVVVGGGGLTFYLVMKWMIGARHTQLRQFAATRGWRYQAGLVRGWENAFTAPPFGVGISRRARDLLSGVYQSRTFVSFEYQYILGGVFPNNLSHPDYPRWGAMGNSRVYASAIVAFPLDWAIPRTEFVPKAVKNTFVAEHVLGQEVGVDGSDNFNDHWLVKSDDPQTAQGLLSPGMVALLMKPGLLGQWFFFENGYLVHHANELRYEGGIEDMLGRSSAILDAVPESMRTTYAKR